MMRILYALILTVAVAACGNGERTPSEEPTPAATIPFRDDGNLTFLASGEEIVTIDIEIAETDSARVRGLMQRTELPDHSGMLFIFERERPQGFHMSNTPIALDLVFVSGDSQIVDIDRYNRPFSQESILSDAPAQYVIEVPAGFADTYGIAEGERVRWERKD